MLKYMLITYKSKNNPVIKKHDNILEEFFLNIEALNNSSLMSHVRKHKFKCQIKNKNKLLLQTNTLQGKLN